MVLRHFSQCAFNCFGVSNTFPHFLQSPINIIPYFSFPQSGRHILALALELLQHTPCNNRKGGCGLPSKETSYHIEDITYRAALLSSCGAFLPAWLLLC